MVDIDALTVRVRPGVGWVARYPGVLLVVPGVLEGQDPQVGDLLELCRTASQEGAQRLLSRRLARYLLAEDEAPALGFAVLAAVDDGTTAVMVAGDVDVVVRRQGQQPERLRGRESPTWVDRLVREAQGFQVTAADDAGGGFPVRGSLLAGVVPGSGVQLVANGGPDADDPTSTDVPASTDLTRSSEEDAGAAGDLVEPVLRTSASPADLDALEPATAVIVVDPTGGPTPSSDDDPPVGPPSAPGARAPSAAFVVDLSEPEPREPLPVAGSAGQPPGSPEPSSVVQVHGIECAARHLNDPRGRFCNVCGRSLVHVTNTLVTGPRPSLGVLVLDGPRVCTLDGDYVLGREPERDDAVAAGRLRPLRLQDEQAVVSRVHAEVRLVGWDVVLEDRGSANGTYVAPAGSQSWEPLVPHQPRVLLPGNQIKVGDQVIRFETRHYA